MLTGAPPCGELFVTGDIGMLAKKIFHGAETAMGAFLILASYCENRPTGIEASLGREFNLKQAVIMIGIFYIIAGIIQFLEDMSEPTTVLFIKKLLLWFEIFSGFALLISSLCDGRNTPIEALLGMEITVHHGVMILGVYFTTKALIKLLLEMGDPGSADL